MDDAESKAWTRETEAWRDAPTRRDCGRGAHAGSNVRTTKEVPEAPNQENHGPPGESKTATAILTERVVSIIQLWFRSSIFIAGFGHGYTEHQRQQRS